ncbi:MAG: prepilin-type N-terminal cleavage/methylation domain-containing protein [Xanthomonadaceae bacterium]|nr:prepilin-type N-terminal cleavage/methylation domain-containing protein [Xanthomonadaceae bacterium]
MNRHAHGFTLLEVLLAVTLLAAALALGFGVVRAAGATVARGELMSQRNERMRAVSQFLRTRIGGAQGIVFAFDRQSGRSLRFEGDARSMRFVADLPDYLGRGGPHLHVLQVVDAGTGRGKALEVVFRLVQAAEARAPARPPEPLVEGLTRLAFAYRSLDDEGKLGPWQPRWENPDAMPMQVRVQITDTQGEWPPLVVTLPQAGSYLAGGRSKI